MQWSMRGDGGGCTTKTTTTKQESPADSRVTSPTVDPYCHEARFPILPPFATLPPSTMPCCPHCGDAVPDVMSHHLIRHPNDPVPACIVREVIGEAPNTRCRICYIPIADPQSHYTYHHVRAVRFSFGGIRKLEVVREPDEKFPCPWCSERIQDAVQFLVSVSSEERATRANTLAETHRALPHPQGLASSGSVEGCTQTHADKTEAPTHTHHEPLEGCREGAGQDGSCNWRHRRKFDGLSGSKSRSQRCRIYCMRT